MDTLIDFISSSNFVSALIGATSGIAIFYIQQLLKESRDRESTRSAFEGEVFALIQMLNANHAISGLESVLKGARSGHLAYKSWPSITFTPKVWDTNSGRIGLLSSESARQLAYIYTMHASALAQLKENESLELEIAKHDDDCNVIGNPNRVIRENLFGAWVSCNEIVRVGTDFLEKRASNLPSSYPAL